MNSKYKVNPYRPGAGLKPTYLAGRDESIEDVSHMFDDLVHHVPTQSVIGTGLRGVGKTVWLNKLEEQASIKGVCCRHLEVETRKDFIAQIADASQKFLIEVSASAKAKHLLSKALTAIKCLSISFNPDDNTFSLSAQDRELFKSNSLSQSLTDVFVAIGEAAEAADKPLCFFIDEMQYMKNEELGSLVSALHRVNQLGYPVMMVGTGLPKTYKLLAEERTYAERLFVYHKIKPLTRDEAEKAVVEPAKKCGFEYTPEAINKIVTMTKGYPFFIQQFCQIVYDKNTAPIIDLEAVNDSIQDYLKRLDDGFFKIRYERCSASEKQFIFAMAQSGKDFCEMQDIAMRLNKPENSISTIRAQLINKGVICVKKQKLAFTVPDFDRFLKRLPEYHVWNNRHRNELVPNDEIR